MNSINAVYVSGRLGADPELRHTNGGGVVCDLRIAVKHSYKKRDATEWTEETSWIAVTSWSKLAERSADLKKGDLILVEGRLNQRTWETKDTKEKRSTVEIVATRIEKIATKKAEDDDSAPF